MMRKVILLLLISFLLQGGSAMAQRMPRCPDYTDTAAETINLFAFDLYNQLKVEKGNLFFSPYSISSALAMTYTGANGETKRQIKETLHLNYLEQPDQEFGQLINQLNQPSKDYKLITANALWAQKDYQFKKPFLTTLKDDYQSELNQLDFKNETEKSRKTINQWVENKTNNKIKDLLKPGTLKPLTRLILTNAIYFQSNWAEQFKKEKTKEAPFYSNKENSFKVKMMQQIKYFPYFENKDLQIVELPYNKKKLSMVIILPKKMDGLDSINLNELPKWEKELKHEKVNLYLPKFKATSEFSLRRVLTVLGMKDAFSSPPADFSNMYEQDQLPLFISDVIHKAYIDVNEAGTEAAAATAVAMVGTAMPRPEPIKLFKADHPFIFYIKDNQSKTILFIGRIKNPES